MGYEMIKDKLVITPQRLYSLLCLVAQVRMTKREELLKLLQPSSISDNHGTADELFITARRYHLIREDESTIKIVSLAVDLAVLVSFDSFRRHMQTVLLGATVDTQDNYLLNLFAAWYAAQDELVMTYSKSEYEIKFNGTLYPHSQERVLAEQPGISAWRTWAEFLGWGWPMKFAQREEMRIVPDATLRIRPHLPDLLPEAESDIPFGVFIERLGRSCPELDGGILFRRCWAASRPNEQRGNRVSLMVSTALRVLHQEGSVRLIYRGDSPETWNLFRARSHVEQVTHIARKTSR